MSLDDRLRDGLPRLAADADPEVDPSLRRVVSGGRRRRTLYRVGAGMAAAAVIAAAAVGVPRALEAVRGERPPVGFGSPSAPSPTPEETATAELTPSPVGGSSVVLTGACPGPLGFEPSHLPEGFSEDPVPGPAPQSIYPAEDGQGVVHWTDGERSFEIRRPGMLFVEIVQEEGGPTITVLGRETADFGPVVPNYEEGPAGEDFMVQFRHPNRGATSDPTKDCTFHSVNEYGLGLDELTRVAEGLTPAP
ncbi:MAG: hypothetical protein ACRDI0_06440 [Actinomycetota bacterium]